MGSIFFFLFFFIFTNVLPFAFGPQHPASHGVLTLIIYMFNEFICFIDLHIGYLHRGTEKLCEFKSIELIIPYLDRLDYVSVSCLRLLFLELTRIFNGLLACACMIFDIGCMS